MTFAGDFLTEETERQSPYNVIQIASIMLKKTLSILSPLGGYNLDNVVSIFPRRMGAIVYISSNTCSWSLVSFIMTL